MENVDVAVAVLSTRLAQMEKGQDERHSENRDLLQQILQQVRSTNGRVTALERWQAETQGSKHVYAVIWGFIVAIAAALIAWILPKR